MAYFSPSSTNGASLEDCHTNVFVLTELNGLKWCRWCSSNSSMIFNDVADDPVLCAYGRCVTQGYLCVWRRSPPVHTSNKIDLRLAAEKELWVFWYGDEPDWGLLCTSLTKIEESSWEKGVEYETRTMLFKALHNQIDRILLNSGYLRFGKWYVHPLEYPRIKAKLARSKYIIAFSFAFFVHGENNVCVTVTAQRHVPVYRLCHRVFENSPKQSVILAPWSISAEVNIDPECSSSELDSQAQECLQEWSKFYALSDGISQRGGADILDREADAKSGIAGLPRVVDVVVRGVKLKYPTRFVGLLVDEVGTADEATHNGLRTSGDLEEEAKEEAPLHSANLRYLICEKVMEGLVANQRCSTEPSQSSLPTKELPRDNDSDGCTQSAAGSSPDESVGAWEFLDISQNDPCRCRDKVGIFCHLKCFPKKGQSKGRGALGKHGVFHRRRESFNPPLTSEPPDEDASDGSYFNCSVGTASDGDTFRAQCRTAFADAAPSSCSAPSPAAMCNEFDAVGASSSHSKVDRISYSNNNDPSAHQQAQLYSRVEHVEGNLVAPRFSGAEMAKINCRVLARSQHYIRHEAEKRTQTDEEDTEEEREEREEEVGGTETPLDVVSDEFYRQLSSCHWYESSSASVPLERTQKKIKLAVHLSDVASGCIDPRPFCADRGDLLVTFDKDGQACPADEPHPSAQSSSSVAKLTFQEAQNNEDGNLSGLKKESVTTGHLGISDFDPCALMSYGDPILGTNCSDNEDDPLNAVSLLPMCVQFWSILSILVSQPVCSS
uniref:Mediator of RNA polymerase II transcription subunit 13 n=1 Tax=Trichuris muris TaxID=70415 RepID=A0A5S6Q3U5_TRIMR